MPGIIYCQTVKKTDKLSIFLNEKFNYEFSQSYHAKISVKLKKTRLIKFLNDQSKIMVATGAFGMGINKKNIRFVIMIGMPDSIDSFHQMIGRSGRDGLPSVALVYYKFGANKKIFDQILGSNRNRNQSTHLLYSMFLFCEVNLFLFCLQ